jgi:APA family basic amino acid/polyamine antiporter
LLVGLCTLAAGVTSTGGLSLAFGRDYLKAFIYVPTIPAASVFLLLVALLNARGIKESVRAKLLMTVIELSVLIRVIVVIAGLVAQGGGEQVPIMEFCDGVHRPLRFLAQPYWPTTLCWF